jgi:hypothetical protein
MRPRQTRRKSATSRGRFVLGSATRPQHRTTANKAGASSKGSDRVRPCISLPSLYLCLHCELDRMVFRPTRASVTGTPGSCTHIHVLPPKRAHSPVPSDFQVNRSRRRIHSVSTRPLQRHERDCGVDTVLYRKDLPQPENRVPGRPNLHSGPSRPPAGCIGRRFASSTTCNKRRRRALLVIHGLRPASSPRARLILPLFQSEAWTARDRAWQFQHSLLFEKSS